MSGSCMVGTVVLACESTNVNSCTAKAQHNLHTCKPPPGLKAPDGSIQSPTNISQMHIGYEMEDSQLGT